MTNAGPPGSPPPGSINGRLTASSKRAPALTTMLADTGVRPDASINVTRPAPATQPTLHNPWKLDIIARPVVRSTRIA
jgi:hypothetical protein